MGSKLLEIRGSGGGEAFPGIFFFFFFYHWGEFFSAQPEPRENQYTLPGGDDVGPLTLLWTG